MINKGFTQQKIFDKEFTLKSDNDIFSGRGTDRYYTNGLFINYTKVSNKTRGSVLKTINQFEIGQKIFTPGQRDLYVVKEIDRPITGYLYAQFSKSFFKQKGNLLKLAASVGTIGPNALAKELLDAYHPFIKINSEFWDWMFDYQLKNELGANLNGVYAADLLKPGGLVQVTPVSNGTIGTTFINFSQSIIFRFGLQNKMHETALWNSRIQSINVTNSSPPKPEFFGYYQPGLLLQAYNATIQGGMITKDKGKIVGKNKPLVLSHRFGAMVSGSRYTAGIHLTYQGREAKSQVESHVFGGMELSYRFH